MLKCTYIFGFIGLLCSIFSAKLYILDSNLYNMIGSLSTIISIILGVVSIVYTYRSGKHNDKIVSEINKEIINLDKYVQYICNQNESMISLINEQLIEKSFDYENLESIKEKINNQILKASEISK